MPSHTPNTQRGRPLQPWMSSMPSRGKDVPSMDSEVKQKSLQMTKWTSQESSRRIVRTNGSFKNQNIFSKELVNYADIQNTIVILFMIKIHNLFKWPNNFSIDEITPFSNIRRWFPNTARNVLSFCVIKSKITLGIAYQYRTKLVIDIFQIHQMCP